MRRCTIPPSACIHPYSTPCCKDCGEKGCKVRCQNDPAFCNCWADQPPRQKRKRKVDAGQVVWLYEQGLTQAQIAEMKQCNRKTVSAVLREMGVTRHGSA